MKNFVLLFCLLLTITTIYADLLDIYVKHSGDVFIKCGKEYGIDEKDPRAIFDKDTNSGKVTCFRACLMKAVGTVENSKLVKDKLLQFAKNVHSDEPDQYHKLEHIIPDCLATAETIADECNMVHTYIKCVLDHQ